MQELISIVVPVYNVEKYLKRCIDSIFQQTYQDYEVILVDDGSSDESGSLCDHYANVDSRLKSFHIQHSGVCAARNFGMAQIIGEWFCFIDSDDWVEPNFLEVLHNNAIENCCDISACQFERNKVYSLGITSDSNVWIFDSPIECVKNYICSEHCLRGMVWNKLYRSSKFRNIQFDSSYKVNEDCLYTFEVMSRCDKACVTESGLYHWYMNENSACHAKPTELDFSSADAFLVLLEKVAYINDRRLEIKLKKNYFGSTLFILWNVSYGIRFYFSSDVIKRMKKWRKELWPYMSKREKQKYCVCIWFPFIKGMIRKCLKKQ